MPELFRREMNDNWLDDWFPSWRGRGMAVFDQLQFLRFVRVEPGRFFFQHERDQKQPVKNCAEGQRHVPRWIEVESAKINDASPHKSGDGNRQKSFG